MGIQRSQGAESRAVALTPGGPWGKKRQKKSAYAFILMTLHPKNSGQKTSRRGKKRKRKEKAEENIRYVCVCELRADQSPQLEEAPRKKKQKKSVYASIPMTLHPKSSAQEREEEEEVEKRYGKKS